MQSAGTTLLVAQRLAVTRQHNIIVAFDTVAEALRILDDANNNAKADPGEHLRVVPLSEHVVFGQGGAPPLGTWAGPISFTKTFGTLPAVTFHRDGSASEAGAVYLTTARAAAGPGHAGGSRVIETEDRKSTRLNSSHSQNSYAVFCLKKKKNTHQVLRTRAVFLLLRSRPSAATALVRSLSQIVRSVFGVRWWG